MTLFRQVTLVLIFCVFTLPAISAENKYDQKYLAMMEKAMTMPDDFDFKVLRDLYTRTSFYKPYSKMPKKDIGQIIDAFKAGDKGAAQRLNNYYIETFIYFDTQIWYLTAVTGQGLPGNPKIADWAVPQILDLTLNAYSGKSVEDAYKVISVGEEYSIIKALTKFYGYEFKDRSLEKINGRSYDVWNVFDKKAEKALKLYFDVTVPFAVANQP